MHDLGKVLWQQHIRPRILGMDAENALNAMLDWLEHTRDNPFAAETTKYLYGNNPYADAPVRIGNRNRGLLLRNRVGIPAGCTKRARGLCAFDDLGAGFIEIGTLTPRPQSGNPKPRVHFDFREAEDLFIPNNWLGFNCEEGVDGPVQHVQRLWDEQGDNCIKATLIWSFGPNKITMDCFEETRNLRLIVDDILYAVMRTMPVLRDGDAIQFNVASPNTPGLRNLFERFEEILPALLMGIRTVAPFYHLVSPPAVLIKLSPDMPEEQLRQVTRIVAHYDEVVALEAFNTTVDKDIREKYGITVPGGTSGDGVRELAQEKTILLHKIIEEENLDIDIIGVGGIMEPRHALDRLAVGNRVKAIQVFSGILKYGPSLIPDILEAIAKTA